MVRAYVGTRKVPTGSGKTLSMMYDVRRFILKHYPNHRYNIISNIDFKLREETTLIPSFKKKSVEFNAEVITEKNAFFEALATRENTIFLVDEMSVWADQYEWKDIPKVFYTRIKQLRKVNIHLVYTVQYFNLVAPRIRYFTEVVVECQPSPMPDIDSFNPPPRPWMITQKLRHPEYFDNLDAIYKNPALEKEFTYKTKRVFLSELKRTFPTFDTLNIVE